MQLVFEDFMKMLHELDNSLVENITIKVIGGFSVIINSKVLGLDLDCDGWLNNSWYDSKAFNEELEQYIEWQDFNEEKFKHITLKYADLESIFLFKVRAVNDVITGKSVIHDRPRDNDMYDIIHILDFFNEKDILNIQNPKMSIAIEMYRPAIEWIAKYMR